MGLRVVLKSLRDFAARELEEKRADRIDVRRVKMESVIRKDRLPRPKSVDGERDLLLNLVFSGKSLSLKFFWFSSEPLISPAKETLMVRKNPQLTLNS